MLLLLISARWRECGKEEVCSGSVSVEWLVYVLLYYQLISVFLLPNLRWNGRKQICHQLQLIHSLPYKLLWFHRNTRGIINCSKWVNTVFPPWWNWLVFDVWIPHKGEKLSDKKLLLETSWICHVSRHLLVKLFRLLACSSKRFFCVPLIVNGLCVFDLCTDSSLHVTFHHYPCKLCVNKNGIKHELVGF